MTTNNKLSTHPVKTDQPVDEIACSYVREVTAKYIGPRRKSIVVREPTDAAIFMRRLLRDGAREHFLALYLNAAHHVISYSLVSLGSATSAIAHPREVYQGAILVGACAVIAGHNHPSGDLEPSREDRNITKQLYDSGQILGIRLLDHLVISLSRVYSFKDNGLIN